MPEHDEQLIRSAPSAGQRVMQKLLLATNAVRDVKQIVWGSGGIIPPLMPRFVGVGTETADG